MPYSGHYVSDTDITNWPAGYTAAQKEAAIKSAEAIVESVLGRHFYDKAFDVRLNGNDQNRLFLNLEAPILTVTHAYLYDIELESTWFTFDEVSLYIALDSQSDVELDYRLHEAQAESLFPRGYNNVRVTGTYGIAAAPEWIKRATKLFIEAVNNPSGKAVNMKSETIGRYSYELSDALAKAEGLTGVAEVDAILILFRDEREPFVFAP